MEFENDPPSMDDVEFENDPLPSKLFPDPPYIDDILFAPPPYICLEADPLPSKLFPDPPNIDDEEFSPPSNIDDVVFPPPPIQFASPPTLSNGLHTPPLTNAIVLASAAYLVWGAGPRSDGMARPKADMGEGLGEAGNLHVLCSVLKGDS